MTLPLLKSPEMDFHPLFQRSQVLPSRRLAVHVALLCIRHRQYFVGRDADADESIIQRVQVVPGRREHTPEARSGMRLPLQLDVANCDIKFSPTCAPSLTGYRATLPVRIRTDARFLNVHINSSSPPNDCT